MKHLPLFRTLSSASLLGLLALAGCAGDAALNFPDTPEQSSQGVIQGSVFGGHAPVVGAHVYVLEASHSGTGTARYGAAAINKMTSGYYGSDTNGNYVITDNNGGFAVGGDYTCDAGSPVYLAAVGGASDGSKNIAITGAVDYGNVFGDTFIEFEGTETLTAGQLVTFSGLTGNFTFLNNTTQSVFGTVDGGFFIAIPQVNYVGGSSTGTATPDVNPAITNMAMVGICPTPPTTFASTIHFVYMNEVSTAALAYGMGGFGSGPFNVGAPGSNTTGLGNAALNAAQLYDIQGGENNGTPDGEGHIGRAVTAGGNGVAPQALMDTLGNILASCVDSANSSNDSNPTDSGASVNCGQLFTYATSNGVPYGKTGAGTVATDTATAAFNIAHYPAGASAYSGGSTGFVQKLYALQGSEAIPFNPYLTTYPNDFSAAITYSDTSGQNLFLASPSGVAMDSGGNALIATAGAGDSGALANLGTLGVITGEAYETGIKGSGIAIGPSTTQYIWTENTQDLTAAAPDTAGAFYISAEPVSSTGGGSTSSERAYTDTNGTAGFYTKFPTSTTQSQGVAISGAGNAYIADTAAGIVHRIATPSTLPPPASGTAAATPVTSTKISLTGCTTGATGLAVDNETSGYNVWAISAANGTICKFGPTGTLFQTATGLLTPQGIAMDNYGNAWVTDTASGSNVVEVVAMPSVGAATRFEVFQTGAGGLNQPYGIAFDGANNIWVANSGNNSVSELVNPLTAALGNVQQTATITPVSPSNGYQPVSTTGTYQLANPTAIAVDISGDVWVTNTATNTVSEIIGSATPVVGPISMGALNNKLATRP